MTSVTIRWQLGRFVQSWHKPLPPYALAGLPDPTLPPRDDAAGVTSVTTRMRLDHCPQGCHAVLLAAVGLVLLPTSTPARHIQFRSEVIDITVQADHCVITGDYFLANEGNVPAEGVLHYPFPIDAGLPFPDSVSVADQASGTPIRYGQARDGIQFPVRIAPHDSIGIRVVYTQRTPERRVRYILTTTRRWGRPLRSADFLIHIPRSLELTHISIAPDSVEHAGTWEIHRIHRSQFMPACDLDLTWKEVE